MLKTFFLLWGCKSSAHTICQTERLKSRNLKKRKIMHRSLLLRSLLLRRETKGYQLNNDSSELKKIKNENHEPETLIKFVEN